MFYVKVENGVVVQKSCKALEGFIEASDEVTNGWLYDGVSFTAPPYIPSPDQPVGVA